MPFTPDPTMPFASSDEPKLENDYLDAFNTYKQTPSPQTRSQLLRTVAPVIDTAIKSYGGPSQGSPMLKSQARQLAAKAFDSYDPSRGNLKTHLLSQLRGLQRYAHQQNQIIQLPEKVGLDSLSLNEASQELAQQLGQEPSDAQLADYTGLSVKRINYIRQARPAIATGSLLHDDSEEENAELPASQIPGVDTGREAWEDLVYYDLGNTDQLIFDHLLGRHGRKQLPPARLAAKLGISQSAVSQRAAKIQKMLDERQDLGVL